MVQNTRLTFAACLSALLINTNCVNKSFDVIDGKAKASKLAGATVFGEREVPEPGLGSGTGQIPGTGPASGSGQIPVSGPGSGSGQISATGPGSGAGQIPSTLPGSGAGQLPTTQPGAGAGQLPSATSPSGGQVALGSLPVSFICSTSTSENYGNLVNSPSVTLKSDECGIVQSTSLRDQILKTKSLKVQDLISTCSAFRNNGKHTVKIAPTSTKLNYSNIDFETINGKYYFDAGDRLELVADYNPDNASEENYQLTIAPALCDQLHSPLVIQLDRSLRPAPIRLTSQAEGVLFDIVGQFSDPAPHTPLQISWFQSPKYVFLALPDGNGQVKGVDQLFGNNTVGPDGERAKNGYAALAKFDGKDARGRFQIASADGFITSADAVFAALRVWQDQNSDGIATANELFPLSRAGITVIDLHYDGRYSEKDRYGNETRMKSVVKTRDGNLHLIFDLWFKAGASN